MFAHTQGRIKILLNYFKRIRRVISIGVNLLLILYLVYSLAVDRGIFVANVILLTITVAYFIFYLIMEFRNGKKQIRKTVKRIYKWCKRLIKLPIIGIAVYDLAIGKSDFDPLSFLLTLLMIVGWILDLLFYFVIRYLEIELKELIASLKKDVKNLPIIGPMILKGTEKAEEKEQTNLIKQQKKQERAAEKSQRKAEKLAAKLAKKQPQFSAADETAVTTPKK